MKKVIEGLLSSIFNVFIPICYFLFILAGIACAIVTSVIEYRVVVDLFEKDSQTLIPFLIVVSLEVTKVFLIFLNKQFTSNQNELYLKSKGLFLTLRGILIFISASATMIYTFYNLHNPEFDKAFKEKKNEIEISFAIQRGGIIKEYDKNIKQQENSYNNKMERYEQEMKMEQSRKMANGDHRGFMWREAKDKWNEMDKKKEEVLNNLNALKVTALSNLEYQKQRYVDSASKVLKSSNVSANKMLSATLQIINQREDYPVSQYIIIICLISILLSIGLEFIIWSAFTVLAINHGDIFAFDIERKNAEAMHDGIESSVTNMHRTRTKNFVGRLKTFGNSIFKTAKKKADDSLNEINDVINNN